MLFVPSIHVGADIIRPHQQRVKPKCGGSFELLAKNRQGANFLAPLYFPSVKPFRWCPIHQKVIMKLRSSSVTRFKEEIGNEKTNVTDGNLMNFLWFEYNTRIMQLQANLCVNCVNFISDLWNVECRRTARSSAPESRYCVAPAKAHTRSRGRIPAV